MKAIRPTRTGGPEVLVLTEAPDPILDVGQVRVRVDTCGVNFVDIYQRSGQYVLPLPLALGAEGAGEVEALGPGVSELSVGDRVAWATGSGSYATHAILNASQLVHLPDNLETKLAAAVLLQGMTAHYLSQSAFRLESHHTCLIHAGAGGVGLLLVQMAKRAGATVVVTVSTAAKAKLAGAAGADHVIVCGDHAFEEQARSIAPNGFDVIYDSVGRATFDQGLRLLVRRGTMVLYGQSSGAVAPFDLQVLNARGSLFVTRPNLKDYVATRAELVQRADYVLTQAAARVLRVHIGGTWPLAQASEAHRALASRSTTGKLLLIP